MTCKIKVIKLGNDENLRIKAIYPKCDVCGWKSPKEVI